MSTAHFRGEGGSVWEMDLPLSPAMQKQLDAGLLVRVSEVTEAEVADQAAELAAAKALIGELKAKLSAAEKAKAAGLDDDEDDDLPPELREFLATPPEAPPAAAPVEAAKPRGSKKAD